MRVSYKVLDIVPIDDKMSKVQVEISPSSWINGYVGDAISFEVSNEEMESAIESRVLWKVKQETGLTLKKEQLQTVGSDESR